MFIFEILSHRRQARIGRECVTDATDDTHANIHYERLDFWSTNCHAPHTRAKFREK